jgi:hypothetical protein
MKIYPLEPLLLLLFLLFQKAPRRWVVANGVPEIKVIPPCPQIVTRIHKEYKQSARLYNITTIPDQVPAHLQAEEQMQNYSLPGSKA